MARKERSKTILTRGDSDSERTTIGRRGFLGLSGIAAVSATGYFAGTAEAASESGTDGLGYGTQPYGASGFGGVETTS